ncbi:uncharacterized protein RCC_07406 [Ramularia collo-cygni]|uniref:Uncharacterized protein n=1 Tax=Ramularia collo-cygni TaxID=112498 RepID=A0A2D3VKH6_9PEZI|nr:uncharacterized protein RCC_07406 [Ramularia collo-cygni]CZT21543.1 uncharacterized protein RCC_07406 [Ramularia collo-cygni]
MLPALPTEIWQKIIQIAALTSDPDRPNSWLHTYLTLRQVSNFFRANTARTYLDTFLAYRDRCIIDSLSAKLEILAVTNHTVLEMRFHSRDPNDEARVIFKASTELNDGPAMYEEWKAKMEAFAEKPDLTLYIISIYGCSLDIQLPGLRYDLEEREMSFEWEDMLHQFILQCVEVSRRMLAIGAFEEKRPGDLWASCC